MFAWDSRTFIGFMIQHHRSTSFTLEGHLLILPFILLAIAPFKAFMARISLLRRGYDFDSELPNKAIDHRVAKYTASRAVQWYPFVFDLDQIRFSSQLVKICLSTYAFTNVKLNANTSEV